MNISTFTHIDILGHCKFIIRNKEYLLIPRRISTNISVRNVILLVIIALISLAKV